MREFRFLKTGEPIDKFSNAQVGIEGSDLVEGGTANDRSCGDETCDRIGRAIAKGFCFMGELGADEALHMRERKINLRVLFKLAHLHGEFVRLPKIVGIHEGNHYAARDMQSLI